MTTYTVEGNRLIINTPDGFTILEVKATSHSYEERRELLTDIGQKDELLLLSVEMNVELTKLCKELSQRIY